VRLGRLVAIAPAALLLLAACAGPEAAHPPQPVPQGFRDPHSASRPNAVQTTHLDLRIRADFARKLVSGRAIWTLVRRDPAAPLFLDANALRILGVRAGGAELHKAKHRLEKVDALRGDALTIELSPGDSRVEVTYETTPESGGLLWLQPAQTAGKKHPYLFSQAQSIHARSFVPCQDTPAVRTTFQAALEIPKDLFAVMGAEALNLNETIGDTWRVFHFRMQQPVPSYLFAFAVGDLKFQPLGIHTGVYAEPSVLKTASREFRDAERMVKTVEKLYGPYRWRRFDILVLPPSFPAGGMENPRLTFVSPTLLAGDRSLVSTIAHELAHSWSGNLVTNASWGDLWLNEGFTTYIEGRVIEALYGRERQQMESMIEEAALQEELATLPPADQRLAQELPGTRDPDQVFTTVPYRKGALFLRRLEELFTRPKFDALLKEWFQAGAFASRTTADFETFLKARLPVDARIDLERWLRGPGLPEDAPLARSGAFTKIEQDVAAWKAGTRTLAGFLTPRYSTQEWLHLIRKLEGLPPERLAQVDKEFLLTTSKNAEIASAWLALAVRSGYHAADARVEEYLLEVGRPKLIKPIYAALAATPEGLARARKILDAARPGYHAVAVTEMELVLAKADKRG